MWDVDRRPAPLPLLQVTPFAWHCLHMPIHIVVNGSGSKQGAIAINCACLIEIRGQRFLGSSAAHFGISRLNVS